LKQDQYLHTPLVLGANGEKLSKQNGAKALELSSPAGIAQALQSAASTLGLSHIKHLDGQSASLEDALALWTQDWANKYQSLTP